MKWTRSTLLLGVSAILAAGCADADAGSPRADGGTGLLDATIVDAGPAPDAGGHADAGGPRDASSDAAMVWCTLGECDPRDETACGDAGVCAPTATGTACVEGTGELEEGAACEAPGECAPGLVCFRQGEGGICARPCCPGEDADAACGSDMLCGGTGVRVDGTATDWWQCVPPRPCDPLAPEETCEPGEGCYIVSSEGDTDCRRAGEREVGESCETQNDCAPGLFCGGLSSPTCVRICRLGDAGAGVTCPADEGSCRAYGHSPPGTGICTVESARAR